MNNTRRNFVIAVGAGVAVLGGAFAALRAPSAEAAVQNGATAPGFSVVDSNGRTRTLDEFAGKTVVLEWTNHGCPYVRKHYDSDNMQTLQREATSNGVVWLQVISSAPGEQGHITGAQAKQLTASRNASPSSVLLDPSGTVGRLYGAKTTPHMFVINPQGRLVYAGGVDDVPTNKVEDLQRAKPLVRLALADVKAGRPVAIPSARPYGCAVKYKT